MEQTGIIRDILLKHLARGENVLAKGKVKPGQAKLWCGTIKSQIQKIYGPDHEFTISLSPKSIPPTGDATNLFVEKLELARNYVNSLDQLASLHSEDINISQGDRVFIGHGRSPLWRELKDFLDERLDLPWDEFNREAVAGLSTFERISEMLDSACFAFLIMTAEDQHDNETTHARQNVVHEVGLFQGRLGPRKAIILLEDGCEEFSNIVGLSQIRFPKGYISACFEELRRVLEREQIIKT